jgi:hypothetical protein
LNRVGLPFFFMFSDENCADHISGGRDVEEECFLGYRRRHDWRRGQEILEGLNSLKKGRPFSLSLQMK